MIRFGGLIFGVIGVILAGNSPVLGACPNQSATFTIPFPTGSATVIPLDSVSCTALDATQVKVVVSSNAVVLTASTAPAVTADALGLHFSANGAPFGSSATLIFSFLPANKSWNMTYSVGGAITPVGSTTTP